VKRLLIVADHSLVAHSIRLALKQTVGFEVAGVIDGRVAARDALLNMRPDVVLVDDMHDPRTGEARDAIDYALARLRDATEHMPGAQRLLLTLRMDDGWMNDAFDAGAHAVLSKSMHPVSLGTMLREVVRGNVVHRFERRPAALVDCPLTLREKEILALVAEGATNGQIARMLWVTEQTVKFHLSNTYRKLGVANRTEASHYAHVNNLVTPAEAVAC
jgi:DNA-binding NarL/FixJ family response regulator